MLFSMRVVRSPWAFHKAKICENIYTLQNIAQRPTKRTQQLGQFMIFLQCDVSLYKSRLHQCCPEFAHIML